MLKKPTKGFTLIELMIVIAIIGILMAYAIPAYRDYVTRSKAGECVSIMNGAKISISTLWNASTPLAAIVDNPTALMPNPNSITGTNVGSVTVAAPGEITCTFSSSDIDLNGETITLIPANSNGSLTWACTHSVGLAIQHVPGGC